MYKNYVEAFAKYLCQPNCNFENYNKMKFSSGLTELLQSHNLTLILFLNQLE